jgi:hypothetical protein
VIFHDLLFFIKVTTMLNVSQQSNHYESYTIVSGVDQAEMHGSLECTHRNPVTICNDNPVQKWLAAKLLQRRHSHSFKEARTLRCIRISHQMPVSYLQDELLLLSVQTSLFLSLKITF